MKEISFLAPCLGVVGGHCSNLSKHLPSLVVWEQLAELLVSSRNTIIIITKCFWQVAVQSTRKSLEINQLLKPFPNGFRGQVPPLYLFVIHSLKILLMVKSYIFFLQSLTSLGVHVYSLEGVNT